MVEVVKRLEQQEKDFKAAADKAKWAKNRAQESLKPIQDKIAGMMEEADEVLAEAKSVRLSANKAAKKKKEISEKDAVDIKDAAVNSVKVLQESAEEVVEKLKKEEGALVKLIAGLQERKVSAQKELDAIEKVVSDRKASIEEALLKLK